MAWPGLSGFRRMKTRLRRVPMTSLLMLALAVTIVLFILSMFTSQAGHGRHGLNPNLPARLSAKLAMMKAALNDGAAWTSNGSDSTAVIYRRGVRGNYEQEVDTTQGRPGDNGTKFDVTKTDGVDLALVDKERAEYGFNMVASGLIPMDRVVPDIRHPECKYWHYPAELPTASVVIVFHNEGLTTLMRTVHSVLLRSPQKLIREVILIDDKSDKADLSWKLEDYIWNHFGDFGGNATRGATGPQAGHLGESLSDKSGKVRLLRNSQREGLINSRTRGAKAATGDVVVFLDAHCEVNRNWLPPLLAPIAQHRRTLTVPLIDGIDHDSFEYKPVYSRNDEHFRGIWEWGMLYKEIGLDMEEHTRRHRVSEPYASPTHAGGLFAIDRRFFAELGFYDPGLLVWGGENFELSFKVWLCGGQLKWVPCSRVGHIYRPFMPYSFGDMVSKRKGPLVLTNYKRVVEVWFDDEYKEYFYTREPVARSYDPGDISEQLALKERLGCKSFDWFMTNVAGDVFKDFPRLPKNSEWGEIRLEGQNSCLDSPGAQPPSQLVASPCHSMGGNQLFRLNTAGQLGMGERCIEASVSDLVLVACTLGRVEGPWKMSGKFLMHQQQKQCATADGRRVYLDRCRSGAESKNQRWTWNEVRSADYMD